MNTRTKGWIAAGLGGALLLGTGGTFALWSDAVTLSGGTAKAGALELTPSEDFGWEIVDLTGAGVPVADDTVELVPGVRVVGTASVSALAYGDLMDATLSAEMTIAGEDVDVLAGMSEKVGEGDWLNVEVEATKTGDIATGEDYDITITLSLADEYQNGNTGAQGYSELPDQSVSVSDLAVTLTQNAPFHP
jgi:alternate signal-mediated exported protein